MKRILIIDDEEPGLDMLKEFFTDAGYEVVTAKDGKEALSKFAPGRFDCIISDLMMPGMDGLEVLKMARTVDGKVAFLMVTGSNSIDKAIQSMKEGASDYITKPFQLEDMMLRVERALQTKKREESIKRLTGLFIISIPLWIIIGIIFGILWKK